MAKVKNAYTNMTKRIAEKTDLFEYQVQKVLVSLVQEIITDLAQGKSVHLMSLGKFWIKKIKPRPGWNPHKKQKVQFGERYIPKFEYGGRAYAFIREEANRSCQGEKDRGDS